MTEGLITSGLFSGLVAKDELNRLMDELYGDGLEQEEALRGEAEAWAPKLTPLYHYHLVPNRSEDFLKWPTKLEAELEDEEEGAGGIAPRRVFRPAVLS